VLKLDQYIKMEEFKRLLVSHLRSLGMEEEMSVVNDGDLKSLVSFMSHLNKELKQLKTEEQKTNFLTLYTMSLACSLVVVFG